MHWFLQLAQLSNRCNRAPSNSRIGRSRRVTILRFRYIPHLPSTLCFSLPLYAHAVQDVFLDHSVPPEVRYLSIIQLKNGIDKYWRKTATKYARFYPPRIDTLCNNRLTSSSAIKKEEKERIKTRALQAGVVEPAPLLALHNALMIAKIMRYEFPQDW